MTEVPPRLTKLVLCVFLCVVVALHHGQRGVEQEGRTSCRASTQTFEGLWRQMF